MVDFGNRLKQLRQKAGLTQRQLAERVWISKAAISNYEQGMRNPSPELLVKLANALHVTTDYLLGMEEAPPSLSISGLTDEDIQFVEQTIALLRKKNSRQQSQE